MNKKIINMMSVDLEDYFCDLPFEKWEKYPNRIIETTNDILYLFDQYKIKCTFFTLGYIGQKFPNLIKEISKRGHEIASHGYAHLDIRKISPEEFENDIVKSITILKDITGKNVLGYRAPYFSISKNSFWALKIIAKYFKYDSSIFPTRTPLYGIPDAPRFIYKPNLEDPLKEDSNSSLIEIPLSTHKIPIIGNIPISGGFYLRFFPNWYIKYALNLINKEGNSSIFYIHPKDLDQHMPKIAEYGWHYYFNLKHAKKKFENILRNFKFTSIENFLNI